VSTASHHYGEPLKVQVVDGKLIIEIGAYTLAHAVAFADWANRWIPKHRDYIRTFAITDPLQFAKDTAMAMQHEKEDGSSPLSDFLDKMTEAALDDGSTGAEFDQAIEHGHFSQLEGWSRKADHDPVPDLDRNPRCSLCGVLVEDHE
jgi:hypothetical protein